MIWWYDSFCLEAGLLVPLSKFVNSYTRNCFFNNNKINIHFKNQDNLISHEEFKKRKKKTLCNYLQQDKLAGLSANQRFVLEVLHEITNIFECAMTKCDVSAGPHDVEMLDRMLELDRQCVLSASLRTGAQKVSSVFTVLEENTFCCMSREVWVKPVQWFDITTLLRHDYRAVDNTRLTVSWLSLKWTMWFTRTERTASEPSLFRDSSKHFLKATVMSVESREWPPFKCMFDVLPVLEARLLGRVLKVTKMGNTDTKLNFRKAVIQLTTKTQVKNAVLDKECLTVRM